jgi:hypothetical protein
MPLPVSQCQAKPDDFIPDSATTPDSRRAALDACLNGSWIGRDISMISRCKDAQGQEGWAMWIRAK